MESKTYKDAGVDLIAAANIKEKIKNLTEKTLGSNVFLGPGGFGGVIEPYPDSDILLVSSTDSVGTKQKIAEAMGNHSKIGADIVNHCINDILPSGAKPLFFLDYIGISNFNSKTISEIVEGLSLSCKESKIALIGGETATLPGIYHDNDYDLVGFIVGTVKRDLLITPTKVTDNDLLIALPSNGLHTNGYSLVRSIFEIDNNPRVLDDNVPGTGETLGEALIKPHKSYLDTFGEYLNIINGLAHITGGSFNKNIPRVMPDDFSVDLKLSSWDPPDLFSYIQKSGKVTDEEMYKVFNMGVGMIAVVSEKNVSLLLEKLEDSWIIGNVNKNTNNKKVNYLD